jgi:hypothetical protein
MERATKHCPDHNATCMRCLFGLESMGRTNEGLDIAQILAGISLQLCLKKPSNNSGMGSRLNIRGCCCDT